VSNFTLEQLQRAEAIAPIVSLQPPYSLLRRDVEGSILPWCAEQGVGVISYSPMFSGMLSGRMTRERIDAFPPDDWRRNSPNFKEPNLTRNLGVAGKLAELGARHGRQAGEVAIAWVLRHPAITGAIVGARRAEQVDGIVGAGRFRLSDDEAAEIERFIAGA
jgi:aryl-alcohol dehydrogenase-like predicted oxidoreductase